MERAADRRDELAFNSSQLDLVASCSAQVGYHRLGVEASSVQPPVHGTLGVATAELVCNSAKAISVDTATASAFSLRHRRQRRLHEHASTPPTNTATRTAVTTAHPIVRLISLSMSSRW